jgi:hypothetical protein
MLSTLSFGLIPAGAPLLPVVYALIMAFIILMFRPGHRHSVRVRA